MKLRPIHVAVLALLFVHLLFTVSSLQPRLMDDDANQVSTLRPTQRADYTIPSITNGFETGIISNGSYYAGLNLVSLIERNVSDFYDYTFYTAILDMEGNTLSRFRSSFGPAKFINSTTVLVGGWYSIYFWNIYTNTTRKMDLPPGFHHHDIEYNPSTNSILTLKEYTVQIDGADYLFDYINEYALNGTLLWSLDTRTFTNYSMWCPYHDISNARRDITHSNTIFWDIEEDIIYYNSRNLNTFYKINHTSSEVLWGLGEYGNFTLYNIQGQEKDVLFYHGHSVEKLNNDTFILFDNDYHNQTNSRNFRSRIIEIQIDEDNMTAQETWSWAAPVEYYSSVMGDADRLPNGNRLGTYGASWGPDTPIGGRLVEINPAGELVWELNFPDTDLYSYDIYCGDRIRLEPILHSPDDFAVQTSDPVEVMWDAWYNFRTTMRQPGYYVVYLNDIPVQSGPFSFSQFWRPITLAFDLGVLPKGNHNLTLEIQDEAGHSTNDTVLVAVGSFYIERFGPSEFEIDEIGSQTVWSGVTSTILSYNITIDGGLHSSSIWSGSDIVLELSSLIPGNHRIEFYLINGTNDIYYDEFWVDVLASIDPAITPNQPSSISRIWNQSLSFSWALYDLSPKSWTIFINGSQVLSELWATENYLAQWNLPKLDESLYNITIIAEDQANHVAIHTTWLTITPPSPPIIATSPAVSLLEWGSGKITLSWEVHGGTNWQLWKNGALINGGILTIKIIELVIDNWQTPDWTPGSYNLTLVVADDTYSTSCTTLFGIILDLGDAYADAIVPEESLWYLLGENALGAPDGIYAQIYLDYGNGHLTLDMGEQEEITDGPGDDFAVISRGGNYTVFVGTSVESPLSLLGTGNGIHRFDLASIGMDLVRFVRVEYRLGGTVELDAIEAINYNIPDTDIHKPQIMGPEDLWVWENQSLIRLEWQVFDDTPWNYTLLVNGSAVEASRWNGSDLKLSITNPGSGYWNISLLLYDLFGNSAIDSMILEVRTVPIQLSLALLIAGTAVSAVLVITVVLYYSKSEMRTGPKD
ncbi:MAG: aryl-sulfate sulfotransferase [Candidatus Thorarchaeota archaeon]